ncbi:GLE1-like protein [Glomus cerebriforme]|uniref:mRNA export factor GLE1 n=1 Tax=Glomus cerebriforme TaxID=658196 RepID=A0A397TV51_9GLOM|nr:GLE1-like protein [Glomus cerebriforme]
MRKRDLKGKKSFKLSKQSGDKRQRSVQLFKIFRIKYERQLQAKKQEEINRQFEENQKKKQAEAVIKAQKDALAAEQKRREEAIRAAEENKIAKENEKLEAEKKALNRLASDEVLKEEEKYRQILKYINDNYAKNPQFKQATLESRKNITLALNTLTNNRTKIIDIATQLDRILKNVQNNQQLYYFLLNFTAKGIVKHAEVDVLSNETAAFPFAHVSVLISTEHPDFMERFMMPRFVKKCPYVLPRYYAKLPNQNVDDIRKMMGYKQNEDQDAYIKRMCAILALYCAIMQAIPLIPNRVNPYSIDHAWTWLARLLNLMPRKITPFLLYIFLKITGSQILQVYRGQAKKLIILIYKAYFQQPPPETKVLSTTSPAAMSRLKTFLENASQKGFTEPEGSIPK